MHKVKPRVFEDQDLDLFKMWLQHFIVEVDGKSIGFCQYYDYALSGETWHHGTDIRGAYSIDYMIGDEEKLNNQ